MYLKHHKKEIHKESQESIPDFFVVCDKFLPLVTRMTIDDTRYNSLTRYKGTIIKSDHMKVEMEANLIFHKEEKHERLIVYNVKIKKMSTTVFNTFQKQTCSQSALNLEMKELLVTLKSGKNFKNLCMHVLKSEIKKL